MVDEITLTNLSSKKSIIIGKDGWQDFWLESIDWGQIEGSHNSYSSYSVPGDTVVGTTILTRPVTITGWIIEDVSRTLDERATILNKFISPELKYSIGYDKYKLDFQPDRSIIYGRGDHNVSNNQMRKFQIVGTSHKPFFEEDTAIKSLFEETNGMFQFPTDFGYDNPIVFGLYSQSGSKLINNTGSCTIGAIIRIEFTGAVTNPKIQDLNNLQYIQLDTSFVNGDVVEINTIPGQKSITLIRSGTAQNYLRYRNPNMSWLKLAPGYNDWNLYAQDDNMVANMVVSVTYTPQHLEVE